jgi:hypothetical protein
MKNKIMVIICSGFLTISALSFADDKQVPTPQASVGELAKENVAFNDSKIIYNDKTIKDSRSKKLVDKKLKVKEQDKKKIQEEQDEKNGLNEKNGVVEKNKQYDKQLTVKF